VGENIAHVLVKVGFAHVYPGRAYVYDDVTDNRQHALHDRPLMRGIHGYTE
jgi:hypothetical protein